MEKGIRYRRRILRKKIKDKEMGKGKMEALEKSKGQRRK
jgi:hypothetical protein